MKIKLITTVLCLAPIVGCGTDMEDIQEARNDLQQTQTEAEQLVADARKEGDELIHETRKIVMDEIQESETDVDEAARENESADIDDQQNGLAEIRLEGDRAILNAKKTRDAEVAEAKREADQRVADAQNKLRETKIAAIKDAKTAVRKAEEHMKTEQRRLIDAKAEMVAAEVRLKEATDTNRESLKNEFTACEKAVAEQKKGVSAAMKIVVEREKELNRVEVVAE